MLKHFERGKLWLLLSKVTHSPSDHAPVHGAPELLIYRWHTEYFHVPPLSAKWQSTQTLERPSACSLKENTQFRQRIVAVLFVLWCDSLGHCSEGQLHVQSRFSARLHEGHSKLLHRETSVTSCVCVCVDIWRSCTTFLIRTKCPHADRKMSFIMNFITRVRSSRV